MFDDRNMEERVGICAMSPLKEDADGARVYECELCPRTFSQQLFLQLHRDTHVGDQISPVHCIHCDQQFLTPSKLEDHIYHHHMHLPSDIKVEEETLCTYCNQQFDTKLLMILHKVECRLRPPEKETYSSSPGKNKRHENPGSATVAAKRMRCEVVYECDYDGCHQKFGNNHQQLKTHLFTHAEYPFMCQDTTCNQGFTKKVNYLKHGLSEHRTLAQLITCSACFKQFDSYGQLSYHKQSDHDDNEEEDLNKSFSSSASDYADFLCKFDDCYKNLGSLTSLKAHYIQHSKHACSKCRALFDSEEELANHSRDVHNYQPQKYICPFCEKILSTQKMIVNHIETAHPKPWNCSQCHKSLFSPGQALRHKGQHQTRYCDICGKRLGSTGELVQHALVDHKCDTVYACPLQHCLAVWATAPGLREHLTTEHHPDELLYRCDKCGIMMYNMAQLEYHLDSDHLLVCQPEQLNLEKQSLCKSMNCCADIYDVHAGSEQQIKKHGDILFKELPQKFYSHVDFGAPKWPVEIENQIFGKFRVFDSCAVNAFKKVLKLKVDVKTLKIKNLRHQEIDLKSVADGKPVDKIVDEQKTRTLQETNVEAKPRCLLSSDTLPDVIESEIEIVWPPNSRKLAPITKAEVVEPKVEVEDDGLGEILENESPVAIKHIKAETELYVFTQENSQKSVKVCINDLQYEDIAATEAPSPPPSIVTTNNYMPQLVGNAAETPIVTAANASAAITLAAVDNGIISSHDVTDAIADVAIPDITPATHLDPNVRSCDATHDSLYESMDISSCTTTSSGPDTGAEGQEHLFLKPLPPPPRVKTNLPLMVQVVRKCNPPKEGDFAKALKITSSCLLSCTIPKQLQKGNALLCQGLVIDLLMLCKAARYPSTVLSSYLYELLPVQERPMNTDCLTLPNSDKLVSALEKMRLSAIRFRAKYATLPKYLDSYLLKEYKPF